MTARLSDSGGRLNSGSSRVKGDGVGGGVLAVVATVGGEEEWRGCCGSGRRNDIDGEDGGSAREGAALRPDEA